MEKKVFSTVSQHKLIEKNDNIVLGLSGGPDSMALLYILLYIKKEIKFNIILAHVNHGVRDREALKDEIFVKNIAEKLDLRYFSTKVDMIGRAKEKNISAEEAGREIRYGFFREIIKKLGQGKIAVAHNKNDQAETLIMRIMRGTGIDGLSGMDFKTGDIIRPILDIDRWKIEEYIENNSIETVIDKTNLETIYTRNKVRIELIPYIEENFNPNIIETLYRLSENAKIDSKYLRESTKEKYKEIAEKITNDHIVVEYNKFIKESLCIKKRIIREAILDLNNSLQGIEEVHVSSVLDLFSERETGKKIDLPDEMIARVSYNDLIIEKIKEKTIIKELEDEDDIVLELGENVLESYGLIINLDVFDKKDIRIKEEFDNIRCFDYEKVIGDLCIRTRNPGDRFAPLGMRGTKKIKDYFIDEKVPRELRNKLPLLIDKKDIIWVIGYRMSEKHKIDNSTKRVLKVEYKNK